MGEMRIVSAEEYEFMWKTQIQAQLDRIEALMVKFMEDPDIEAGDEFDDDEDEGGEQWKVNIDKNWRW